MQVNFYASLRLLAGAQTADLPLPSGATVRQLLLRVIERYPRLERELFDERGLLRGAVHVLVNGRDARRLERALDSPLGAGDQVDLFPAVGGG
ncbi:MAG: MoaD family protein [Planctomycetes bacterium]|nr:MoaD family protein [Planctomycetota bacterium]